jgi:phosphoglycerol transferase MdoB-like AlkP superfamily enzyme
LVFAALFVGVIEWYFFAEFDGRFNFVAVDYLVYPTEVVDNIRESYPLGPAIALPLLIAFGAAWVGRHSFRRAWTTPAKPAQRLAVAAVFLAILAGLTFWVRPTFSRVSSDRVLNEVAANGPYSFFQALLGHDAPYEGLYATRPAAQVFARLPRLLGAQPPLPKVAHDTFRLVRSDRPQRRLNVVVVLEESLGSEFIGTLTGRQPSLTPEFDALSRRGTLLTHAFSTGNRTIRAIEATTASLPPLPGASIVRRAASRELFTLPGLLRDRGYQTSFIYGGRAIFDGMSEYLAQNGVDRIIDQGAMPAGAFTTAWGVADETIFDRALEEMDAMSAGGKPFYSLVLTVSNHRPYEFPQDQVKPLPGLRRRENVVRYADYALGRFMRQAREHGFAENTIFVLMGDHGARVYGAAEIPLASYEVPILIVGPGIEPGARLDTITSSLDIPPTVLAAMGFDYESLFFGHDVLHLPPAEGRALMGHNSEIALMRGGRMAVLGLHEQTRVYDVDVATGAMTALVTLDAEARRLIEDAIAYYDGADTVYRSGEYTMQEIREELAALAAAS